ncbi:hypothetical protein Tco_0546108, partial [Tanacetum coccineum]
FTTNSEHYEALPPKETVKAALATLGLVDEKNPHLTPFELEVCRDGVVMITKYQPNHVIAYNHSLIWGLDVDMGNFLFSELVVKLVNCKKLTTLKPHHINAASFNKNPSTSKVPLISHMLKMVKINEFEKSLLLSYGEVNTDSAADKSLSGTTVQSATQSKAPINKELRKKKISSSFEPKTSTNVRHPKQKKPVTET